MQQLSGLDTGFLSAETPKAPLHVSALLLLDPKRDGQPDVTVADVRATLEERMYELPLARRRLVEVPMRVDNPYWVDDADFDADFHIRHVGVASPGDDKALAELVARISARPLDRSKPLWETYFIEGLANGDIAILTKVHHASVDGVGGIELLSSLLDLTPEPRAATPLVWKADEEPDATLLLTLAAQRMIQRPQRMLQFQRDLFESFASTNPRAVPLFPVLPLLGNLGTAGLAIFSKVMSNPTPRPEQQPLQEPPATIPRTVFNGSVSGRRRFAYGSVSLDDIKKIRKGLDGVTVNDVLLCLVAEVLRPWFEARGELPEESMVAMVPVSVRLQDQAGDGGNQVSMMIAPIHTDIVDPMERLRAINESMKVVKEDYEAVPAEMLADFAEFSMPGLAALASRASAAVNIMDRIDPVANVTVSNVPGPQFPLYAGGAKVKGLWPCSAVADGMGLNVTVVSYDGDVCFGFLGCRQQLPDAWPFIDGLDAAVERMLASVG